MKTSRLAERDQAEIRRSAEEAQLVAVKPAQVQRYLCPTAETAYPLEYAFHLLGDARGKIVLDLGCGTGENMVPLVRRGASVIGMDISPELVSLADARLAAAGAQATLRVGSAYTTGLDDRSVDIIFCVALLHHLDIATVRDEMLRILSPDGAIILSEPIRFSSVYHCLRSLLPARENISDFEHPLTSDELGTFTDRFQVESARYFRTPLVPLVYSVIPASLLNDKKLWGMDRWILLHYSAARRYATNVTMRLRKTRTSASVKQG